MAADPGCGGALRRRGLRLRLARPGEGQQGSQALATWRGSLPAVMPPGTAALRRRGPGVSPLRLPRGSWGPGHRSGSPGPDRRARPPAAVGPRAAHNHPVPPDHGRRCERAAPGRVRSSGIGPGFQPGSAGQEHVMTGSFRPHVLREYSLIADGERGAVIGPDGAISWLCAPGLGGHRRSLVRRGAHLRGPHRGPRRPPCLRRAARADGEYWRDGRCGHHVAARAAGGRP
jgi:hypothetical protein